MDLTYFNDENGDLKAPPVNPPSHCDVVRVIERHQGQNDTVVDAFVVRCLDAAQWAWLAQYQAWVIQCETLTNWNTEFAGTLSHQTTERVVTGTGDNAVISYVPSDVLFVAKELPIEPTRPFLQTLAGWKAQNYSLLRAAAYPSISEQLGALYDDKTHGTNSWLDGQNEVKGRYVKAT